MYTSIRPATAAQGRTALAIVAILSLLISLFAIVRPVIANHVPPNGPEVTPRVVEASEDNPGGNVPCPAGTTEYKFASAPDGTYSSGNITLSDGSTATITVTVSGNTLQSFVVTGGLAQEVHLKATPASNIYNYSSFPGGGIAHDDGLVSLATGDISHITFCLVPGSATKTGTKFHDLNANGVWDAGEPGLPGWVIYADLNTNGVLDAGEPSATTGTGGTYSITGLRPATYTFREVQQVGWTCSFPVGTCAHTETLAAGQTSADNNFGNYQNGAKTGTKFHDLNANGVRDAGELGLSGWVIYVDLNNNSVIDAGEPSATTDANGAYSIIGLKPGTYTFREVQKAGWTCSFPATTCAHIETLASGQTASGNDFGNWTTATKTGTKFNDLNANGAREANELGLSGWVIYADLNNNSVRDTGEPFATTDANGAYSITGLRPGTYTFREVQQAGWSCIFPLTTCAHTETLTSGQISANNDFGNRQNEATLGGNPTPTPTPTPVVRQGTLAGVPDTAMDQPMDQLPVVLLALLTLGSLGYLGRRNLMGVRNRR